MSKSNIHDNDELDLDGIEPVEYGSSERSDNNELNLDDIESTDYGSSKELNLEGIAPVSYESTNDNSSSQISEQTIDINETSGVPPLTPALGISGLAIGKGIETGGSAIERRMLEDLFSKSKTYKDIIEDHTRLVETPLYKNVVSPRELIKTAQTQNLYPNVVFQDTANIKKTQELADTAQKKLKKAESSAKKTVSKEEAFKLVKKHPEFDGVTSREENYKVIKELEEQYLGTQAKETISDINKKTSFIDRDIKKLNKDLEGLDPQSRQAQDKLLAIEKKQYTKDKLLNSVKKQAAELDLQNLQEEYAPSNLLDKGRKSYDKTSGTATTESALALNKRLEGASQRSAGLELANEHGPEIKTLGKEAAKAIDLENMVRDTSIPGTLSGSVRPLTTKAIGKGARLASKVGKVFGPLGAALGVGIEANEGYDVGGAKEASIRGVGSFEPTGATSTALKTRGLPQEERTEAIEENVQGALDFAENITPPMYRPALELAKKATQYTTTPAIDIYSQGIRQSLGEKTDALKETIGTKADSIKKTLGEAKNYAIDKTFSAFDTADKTLSEFFSTKKEQEKREPASKNPVTPTLRSADALQGLLDQYEQMKGTSKSVDIYGQQLEKYAQTSDPQEKGRIEYSLSQQPAFKDLLKRSKSVAPDFIKRHETFQPNVYDDGAGNQTVGYGHKLTADEIESGLYKDGVTEEQADALMYNDIEQTQKLIRNRVPNFAELPQNQQDALSSYIFNAGNNAFINKDGTTTKFLQHLKSGNMEEAINEMDITMAGGKVQRGLVKRRAEEQYLARTPANAPNNAPPSDQEPHYLARNIVK